MWDRASQQLPEPGAVHQGREEAHAPRTPASDDAPPAIIRRFDVVVGRDGIGRALLDAGVSGDARGAVGVLVALDEALLMRADIYAVASEGKPFSLWLDEGQQLVGVRVEVAGALLVAARYRAALAPAGFYDDRGFSLARPLRARPVDLSLVTSRFGERFDPVTAAASSHRGVDYAVAIGTAVLAAGDGRVKACGTSNRAGNFLKLEHVGGFESVYLHLDSFAGTHVGAVIAQHQVIARGGNTGRSTVPHVHYELHVAGEALDPQRTTPIPDAALGPLALRQHRAFIKNLQALEATR